MGLRKSIYRAGEIRRQEGVFNLILRGVQHSYNNFVRPLLPANGLPRFNGVKVEAANNRWRRPHVFDEIIPWETPVDNYKEANLQAVRSYVEPGDNVVVVGGGFGVTSVSSANIVGDSGAVTVYEGSKDRSDSLKTTFDINNVSNICEVRHAIVGEAIDVKGNTGKAPIVAPSKLNEPDVLELDCEGAEKGILKEIESPDRVIVETHPSNQAPTDEIIHILTEKSYEIVDVLPDSLEGDVVVAQQKG